MSTLIAVTGKGGVGKTTLSALLVRQMIENGKKPVLAIDADPNSCLDAALGVSVTNTVGGAREEAKTEAQKGLSAGISKQEFLRMKIEQSLVEAEGFDLISMGRPEGAGCYCYANNVLKSVIAEISSQYPYVVLDNEAGLENLSRRIVQKVDMLVLVSDASNAGLKTLSRLHALADEMEIKYDRLVLVVNRIRGDRIPAQLAGIREETGADEVVLLPEDDGIAGFAEENKCFMQLPDSNAVLKEINRLVASI